MNNIRDIQRRMGESFCYADAATKIEVEFDKKPGKHKIASFNDREVEKVAKRLGLWDGKSDNFPGFVVYENGQEIGGG